MAAKLKPEQLIFGRQAVLEALRAGDRITRLYMVRGLRGPQRAEVHELAAARGVEPEGWSKAQMDRLLPGRRHQGLVAVVEGKSYTTIPAMLEAAERAGEAPLLVVLDAVEDPRNLGAVIRSLAVLGAHGLVLPRHQAPNLGPTVAKAAAGMLERLPVARVANISQCLQQLKDAGLWVMGADPEAAEACDAVDLSAPLALVIGGEAKGIRPLVRRTCDRLMRIPGSPTYSTQTEGALAVAPLNLSVATAILLYEVQRQRRSPAQPPEVAWEQLETR